MKTDVYYMVLHKNFGVILALLILFGKWQEQNCNSSNSERQQQQQQQQ